MLVQQTFLNNVTNTAIRHKTELQSNDIPPDPILRSRQPNGNESFSDLTNFVALSQAGSRAQEHEPETPSQAAWPDAASAWRNPLCLYEPTPASSHHNAINS